MKLEMEKNKETMIEMIGQKLYDEQLDILTKIVEKERVKNFMFKAIKKDVVDRLDKKNSINSSSA